MMKTHFIVFFILIFYLLFSQEVNAQLDNSGLFYSKQDLSQGEVGDLDLNIYGLGFNKNNEYYEKTATGYTLFGYLLRPELSYLIHENFSVKAGLIARKDFGNNNYTLVQPTFLIQYDFDKFNFLFGTIRGPLEHQYVEPIYDFERIVTNNPENGLQILYNSKFLSTDAWISWNRMIYDRSPFREEFNGGINLDFKLIENDKFHFKIPLQSIATHVGGQIDDDPNPATTVTNFAAGIDLGLKTSEEGFIKKLELKSYVLAYYSLETESIIPPYRDGNGIYLNGLISTHLGDLMISYWNGVEFSSWNGGHLYQSTSKNWREPNALEPNREVLILRFLNDLKISDEIHILPRFEPYWNLNSGKFGFSMGLYIKFQENFHIANLSAKN